MSVNVHDIENNDNEQKPRSKTRSLIKFEHEQIASINTQELTENNDRD